MHIRSRDLVIYILLVAIGFGGGLYIGANGEKEVTYTATINERGTTTSLDGVDGLSSKLSIPKKVDMTPFWKTWKHIDELYIGDLPSSEKRVWNATQGLVRSLDDPYSTFFPPKESKYFESEISGDFEGVGMKVDIRDGVLTVVAPLKGTPAEEAGVQPGDKIIRIDDTSTEDLSLDEAVQLIRGKKGTDVVLTVIRESESQPLEISVTRDTINIPVIQTTTHPEERIFRITLHNFSAPSSNKFRNALREFVQLNHEQGYRKLILDLRNNPGGFLQSAVDAASWFLPAGTVIVKEDYGDKRDTKKYRSKGYNVFNENLEMVILVNKGSASASEILAGTLQQHDIATLVGTQTFGKGSVQQLVTITEEPETSLKITVARWLLPDGTTISENGVAPDVEVPLTEENTAEGDDPQLQRAIDILSGEEEITDASEAATSTSE